MGEHSITDLKIKNGCTGYQTVTRVHEYTQFGRRALGTRSEKGSQLYQSCIRAFRRLPHVRNPRTRNALRIQRAAQCNNDAPRCR